MEDSDYRVRVNGAQDPNVQSAKLAHRLVNLYIRLLVPDPYLKFPERYLRVITVFDGLLCKLAEGFLASTPRANLSVGGSPPGLTPV
jgi:hypothetical protein